MNWKLFFCLLLVLVFIYWFKIKDEFDNITTDTNKNISVVTTSNTSNTTNTNNITNTDIKVNLKSRISNQIENNGVKSNYLIESIVENFLSEGPENNIVESQKTDSNSQNSELKSDDTISSDNNSDKITSPEPNFITQNQVQNQTQAKSTYTPRYIWVYWENVNRTKYPTIIKLCLDTIKKHLGTKYKLNILNERSIKMWLPDLRDDFNDLQIAQKVDYYRIALLKKHGGIWIDSDIIVMRDFDPIFRKLDEGYDYVGFGCTGYQCTNGKFYPSNWFLGSKPNGILVSRVLELLDKKLDDKNKLDNIPNDKSDQSNKTKSSDSDYHDYGKLIIWQALNELKNTGYDYYHFTSEHDGTRDKDGYWIHTPNFFSKTPSKFLNESKLFFVVLYNSEMKSDELKWVHECEEEKLVYNDYFISSLFKKALGFY